VFRCPIVRRGRAASRAAERAPARAASCAAERAAARAASRSAEGAAAWAASRAAERAAARFERIPHRRREEDVRAGHHRGRISLSAMVATMRQVLSARVSMIYIAQIIAFEHVKTWSC